MNALAAINPASRRSAVKSALDTMGWLVSLGLRHQLGVWCIGRQTQRRKNIRDEVDPQELYRAQGLRSARRGGAQHHDDLAQIGREQVPDRFPNVDGDRAAASDRLGEGSKIVLH